MEDMLRPRPVNKTQIGISVWQSSLKSSKHTNSQWAGSALKYETNLSACHNHAVRITLHKNLLRLTMDVLASRVDLLQAFPIMLENYVQGEVTWILEESEIIGFLVEHRVDE